MVGATGSWPLLRRYLGTGRPLQQKDAQMLGTHRRFETGMF